MGSGMEEVSFKERKAFWMVYAMTQNYHIVPFIFKRILLGPDG